MAETSISGIEFKIVGSTGKAKTAVDKLTSSLKGLKTALSSAHTAKLEKELEGIDKNAKKSTTTLGKLFKSIGRIGFYRAIRSALKFITEGFREGLQNAYQFSKVVGYDLAATMDNLATKSLTMKNQLGSAFGGLLMAIEPILLQIISLVTRAANALAQFFAAIGGKETYLKAIDTVTEYGEAVSGAGQAAKEAMRYLAPFDELNVLPAQNEPGGGGGGASTPDYSQMFEESPVMQKLAEFGASLKLAFNDMFIDWTDLNPEQISEKIIGAILGLTGFLAGITITGSLTGGLIVGIAGVATALVFNSVVFDHDGVLDKREIQSMLRLALIGITGGLIGFAIGGPGGALIGASIGLGLDAALEAINFFTDGKIEGAMDGLVRGISAGLGGVIGFMIGGPAGAVLGATIGLGISFGLENFVFGDTTGWSTGDWIRNIVATLAPVAGAAIGLVVGGPLGALIGATIGLGIQFALNADTTEGAENSGKTLGEKILEGIGKPFKSIGEWINTHIVEPIKEKLKNFSITELLFGEGDESGTPAAGSAASFGYEVEITDVKDSVDPSKKTLKDFFADLFGTKDSIPSDKKNVTGVKAVLGSTDDTKLTLGQKIVNSVKALFGSTDQSKLPEEQKTVSGLTGSFSKTNTANLTAEQKTIPTTANMNSVKNSLTEKAKPSIPTTAYFNTSTNILTGKSKPTIPTTANMNEAKNSLTGKNKPTVPTTANFDARKTGDLNKVIDTTANFTKRRVGKLNKVIDTTSNFKKRNTGELNKVIDTTSNFKWWQDSINGTPEIDTKAKITSTFVDPLLATPTIDVNARITGSLGNYTMATGGAYYGNSWHGIPQAASGGKFHGTLFWAGESGAEVVGHAGGRTEVLNRSQLAATMYAAVHSAMSGVSFQFSGMRTPESVDGGYDEEAMYRAMLRALNDSDNNDRPIELDGDVLYRKMVQRNQMNTRMTGRNVMATA